MGFGGGWKLDGDRHQASYSWNKRDWMSHVLMSNAGVGRWRMGGWNVVDACVTCQKREKNVVCIVYGYQGGFGTL